MPSEPPGVASLQEWLQEGVGVNLQSLMMFGASLVLNLVDERDAEIIVKRGI